MLFQDSGASAVKVVKTQLYFSFIRTIENKMCPSNCKINTIFPVTSSTEFSVQFGLPVCRMVYKASMPRGQIWKKSLMGRVRVMLEHINGE